MDEREARRGWIVFRFPFIKAEGGVMVSVSVSVSPLRPLSRVASDYSSSSVVGIGSSASFASFA